MAEKYQGLVITYPGDPSVGIFDQQWTISGEIRFIDDEEREMFDNEIFNAFEVLTGGGQLLLEYIDPSHTNRESDNAKGVDGEGDVSGTD